MCCKAGHRLSTGAKNTNSQIRILPSIKKGKTAAYEKHQVRNSKVLGPTPLLAIFNMYKSLHKPLHTHNLNRERVEPKKVHQRCAVIRVMNYLTLKETPNRYRNLQL